MRENRIVIIENEEKILKKRAAYKELYSEAKKIACIQEFLNTWILLGINIAIIFCNVFGEAGQAVTVIILLMDTFYFKRKISSLKEDAAMVQQEFDYTVYGLDSNLLHDEVHKTLIEEYSEKYLEKNKSYKDSEDWYPLEIENLPLEEAIIKCQKANYLWDKDLRNKYNNRQLCKMLAFCLVYIGAFWGMDISFRDVLSKYLFSMLPLVLTYMNSYLENKSSIEEANKLVNYCNRIKEFKIGTAIQLQERIFNYRKNCYLIPDKFYEKNKKSQEERMKKTIKE